MASDLKENMKDTNTWIRGFFILLFAAILGLAKAVVGFVVLFQFGHTLFTRQINERLLGFGASLAIYIQCVVQYLTYNTDEKPFPFGEWPGTGSEVSAGPADRPNTPGEVGESTGMGASEADEPVVATKTKRKPAGKKKSAQSSSAKGTVDADQTKDEKTPT